MGSVCELSLHGQLVLVNHGECLAYLAHGRHESAFLIVEGTIGIHYDLWGCGCLRYLLGSIGLIRVFDDAGIIFTARVIL